MRKIVDINPSENIIALLAVGHYFSDFQVTKSSRKNVNKIIKIH